MFAATGWTLQSPPDPSGSKNTDLHAVSCTSASFCIAVGETEISGVVQNVAEYWNGSTWALQSVPSPAGASLAYLNGVSCPSTTDCSAAGGWYPTTDLDNFRALAEQWTG